MRSARILTLGAMFSIVFYFAGCAQVKTEKSASGAAAPQGDKAVMQAVGSKAKEAAGDAKVLSRGDEQKLSKELLKKIAEYYELLEDKYVEKASLFVKEEHRAKFVDDLWEFVANYKVQSADVVSYQLHPQADGVVLGQAKVMRTLFKTNEITPTRQPIYMMWEYDGAKWYLRPQVEK